MPINNTPGGIWLKRFNEYLNNQYKNMDWYDIDFKMEREELADLEYLDPLVPMEDDLEFLDEPKTCTCEIDEDTC